MPPDEITALCAVWGAGLSTLLALGKAWEIWRDRFRIDIGWMFSSSPKAGNKISIQNLSGTPIVLSHWEVLLRRGIWPFADEEVLVSPDSTQWQDTRIEAHSSLTLSFCEADWFGVTPEVLGGRAVWIRLYMAGRSPALKKVID